VTTRGRLARARGESAGRAAGGGAGGARETAAGKVRKGRWGTERQDAVSGCSVASFVP
jgi:hypothetical protein